MFGKSEKKDLAEIRSRLERLESAVRALHRIVKAQGKLLREIAAREVPVQERETVPESQPEVVALKRVEERARPGEPLLARVDRLLLDKKNLSSSGRLKRRIRRKVAKEYGVQTSEVHNAEEHVLRKMRLAEPRPRPKLDDYPWAPTARTLSAPTAEAEEMPPSVSVAPPKERRRPTKIIHGRYSKEIASAITMLQKEFRSPVIRESARQWLMMEEDPEKSASRFVNSYYSKHETPPKEISDELLENYAYPRRTIEPTYGDFRRLFKCVVLDNGMQHFPELCEIIMKRLKVVSSTAPHRDLQSLTESDVRQLIAREISSRLRERGALIQMDSATLKAVVSDQLEILTTELNGRKPRLKTREIDGETRYFSWYHIFDDERPKKSMSEIVSEERRLRRGVLR